MSTKHWATNNSVIFTEDFNKKTKLTNIWDVQKILGEGASKGQVHPTD